MKLLLDQKDNFKAKTKILRRRTTQKITGIAFVAVDINVKLTLFFNAGILRTPRLIGKNLLQTNMTIQSKILVTGGSGLLGNNLLRAFLNAGNRIATLSRQDASASCYNALDVEVIQADITDAAAVEKAIASCDCVVHSAAHIHIGWTQRDEAMRINEQGTLNIAQAANRLGKPMVHVSTVNVLAIGQQEEPADENTPGDGQIPLTYVLSKRAAENAVKQEAAKGLQTTFVYPGFMLGPWDWKPSSGRMIVELSKRWVPMAPAGGCSVCDARDVAAGIVSIVQRQIWGERFVLAGNNMTYFDLWRNIKQKLGKRPPLTILRKPGRLVVGGFSDRFLSSASQESETNSAAIAIASQFHYYSSAHAQTKLGYKIRDFQATLDDSIHWLTEHGLLKKL